MSKIPVKFQVNNETKEILVDPWETLLEALRDNIGLTGTKEGCAEGGCGACTVVLGDLKNNKIVYQAINSCIAFVPSLEGKQLILVEDLVSKNGTLHTVQDAMINYHGSQCGFCTPGQVMSAVALLNDNPNPTREEVRAGLSGNLCRCGAYEHYINGVLRASGQLA